MNQTDRPSSPVDASPFQFVVGIDIGSQFCSICGLKPDKSQVIRPTEFANAPAGFGVLQEKLEQLGVPPAQVLIGLEATSRYGENLYHFLEGRGYQLCLLHPRQPHQFAKASRLASKNGQIRCDHDCADAFERRGSPRLCAVGIDCDVSRIGAAAYAALGRSRSLQKRDPGLARCTLPRVQPGLSLPVSSHRPGSAQALSECTGGSGCRG